MPPPPGRMKSLAPGDRVGPYEVLAALGAGGPASVRAQFVTRELRRGLAEAKQVRP
jgi:hypothetical protein